MRGKVGKPKVPMALNPDGVYSFGLKIGRRSAELILMDFVGSVRATKREAYKYPTPDGIRRFVRENGRCHLDQFDPQSD